jgi:hypothetical protein
MFSGENVVHSPPEPLNSGFNALCSFARFDRRPRHNEIARHVCIQGLEPPESQKFERNSDKPNLERFLGPLLAEGLASNLG